MGNVCVHMKAVCRYVGSENCDVWCVCLYVCVCLSMTHVSMYVADMF